MEVHDALCSRRRLSGSVIVATAAFLVAACGSNEEAAQPWPADEPAWAIQGEDGRLVVQLITAEGSGLHALAPDAEGGDQTNPDWSPDGARVTFVMTDAEGKDDLWAADADGANARPAYDCAGPCNFVDDPAWSPDGSTIAACMLSGNGQEHLGTLAAIDVETGVAATLFAPRNPADFCAGPRWSPDGTHIVLELGHRDGTKFDSNITGVALAVLDVTRSNPRPHLLTDPSLFAATADWSPDGKTIVYAALPDPRATNTDLFTIDPGGGKAERLTTLAAAGSDASEPGFDADGRSVVFVSSAAPGLVRIDADGGNVAAAFATEVRGRHPRARPLRG